MWLYIYTFRSWALFCIFMHENNSFVLWINIHISQKKICINTTKPLIFVHFFILAQQISLHNEEGKTVSYSSSFPCFLQEDWRTKCKLFYLVLFKVIPVKVVKVVMVKVVKLEIWWEKKVLKIVYINNILFIYTIFRREKYFQKSSLTTLTMTTLTTFVLFPKVTM